MLGTYQNAIFAVPENPVMRAVTGFAPLMKASEQKGVTGLAARGLGCAGNKTCDKCSQGSPFGMGSMYQPVLGSYRQLGIDTAGGFGKRPGMITDGQIAIRGFGNVDDFGLRLYGDFYGAQQHGGMIINGDVNGLGFAPRSGFGTYFPSDAHAYRGFSGLGHVPRNGLGDVGTFLTNLTSGNIGDALSEQDIVSGVPNWIMLPFGLWILFSLIGDTKRSYGKVKKVRAKSAARRKKIASAKKVLAEA